MAGASPGDFIRAGPGRAWLLGLIAAGAILLAYSPVRTAGFIWDDDAHVTANPSIVGPQGLKEIWTSAAANYFPLTMTAFWAQHALWGLSPAPYHAVNVLFHAGCALLLWRILRKLRVPGAWLGAMLWALHPVQVESVAWISELKNTQSCFFFLLATWFFVRWMQRGSTLEFQSDYLMAVIAAVLAILSKSSTVMLPVVFGLIGWWSGKRRWRDGVWLVPFFALSAVAGGWTIWEQKIHSMASGPEWDHGLASRLVIAGKVVWFYLGKLLWPDPLIFIYPRWDVNDIGALAWIPTAALGGVAWFLWRHRAGRLQPVFVAMAYFVVTLFPVLGLFDVFFFRYSFVGDHLQYLASIAPLALIGAAIHTGVSRFAVAGRFSLWAQAAVLVAVGFLTWHQAHIYRNNLTLWRRTADLNPDAWIARVNLGTELLAVGKPELAVFHFETAVRMRPRFTEVELNWGNALIQLGRPGEAIPHLERAVHGARGLADAHNSLGLALSLVGRVADAIPHYQEGLRLRPEFDAAHFNLGNALAQMQKFPEAILHYEAAVRIAPRSALYRNALARTALMSGRRDQAIEHFRATAMFAPDDFEAQCTLANLLAQSGAFPEAIERGQMALRLRADSAECHTYVGNALLLSGKAEPAILHYENALRLRPDYLDARSNLAHALFQSRRAAEAVPHYAAVVQARPESADAHNNLASALMQSGKLAEAIAHYETAVRLTPDNPEPRSNLALALAGAGRFAEAIEQCRAALRVRPDYQPARQNLINFEAAALARGNQK